MVIPKKWNDLIYISHNFISKVGYIIILLTDN